MHRTILQSAFVAASFAAALAGNAPGQATIPLRVVNAPVAVSTDTVNYLFSVRELSDGRVLANDAGARRAVIFGRDLASAEVIADSASVGRRAYGKRPTGIISYHGDTTLLIDVMARSFVQLDGKGVAGRVMSPPRADDVPFLWNPALGTPAFDPAGRLIYRGTLMPSFLAPDPGKPIVAPDIPDSAPILRGNFETRQADTLGWVRIPKMRVSMTATAVSTVMRPMINPVSFIDDWAMLPDGSIAILRGSDYHIDWIGADGKRWSTPKMPFDWKRLSDIDKQTLIDSTKAALARQDVGLERTAPGATMMSGHSMTIARVEATEGGPAPRSTAAITTGPAPSGLPEVIPASDLPDYLPPVLNSGMMKVDPAGNIWLLPSSSTQSGSGLVYDVVDRSGTLFERVRLPAGRALVGFGRDGAVYLTSHAKGPVHLERAFVSAAAQTVATASADTLSKVFVGTWDGTYTSDHTGPGGMRLVVTRDSVWHGTLAINGQMPIPTAVLREFTVTASKVTWKQDLMQMECTGSADLVKEELTGSVACGPMLAIPFVLRKK